MGRMIREYPDKDKVKMYCFAPAMEIGLVQGKMAKITAKLSGGTEYEILECIPLTEYTDNGPCKISPDSILAEVQEFFKRLSKDRLPSASLESALSGVDLSVWQGLNIKKFKKSAPSAGVTEDNGAKVKHKLGTDPRTGLPRTKDEINKLEQIANAIQTVMVEAKWIAYSIDNYDYSEVLSSPVLAKMFPEEIDAVITTINNDAVIKDMVIKNLNDKQLAYKGLAPIEVYNDIFMNNEYKRKIGLVYVNFDMAKDLVDKLPKSKYNKEGVAILVFNALSGTIPLLLKEKFPKARIVCAEYFEYFKDHLTRLGFEVVGISEDNNGKLCLEKDNDMKFDVPIGNPPYQDPTGQNTIYPKFYAKAIEVCKPGGHIAMITPPAIIPGLWGVKNPDGIKMPEPIQTRSSPGATAKEVKQPTPESEPVWNSMELSSGNKWSDAYSFIEDQFSIEKGTGGSRFERNFSLLDDGMTNHNSAGPKEPMSEKAKVLNNAFDDFRKQRDADLPGPMARR
jgi:hypothetical protein